MFRRRSEEELWNLQRELIAAEEEDEYEEYDDDPGNEDWEDYDDEADEDDEEEDEPVGPARLTRYRRGNPKKFKDKDFFDDDGFADEDVLYRRDYKKAKRKKRRKAFGLILLAILEIIILGALILWFMSWM